MRIEDKKLIDVFEQWFCGDGKNLLPHKDAPATQRLISLARRGAATQWRPIEEAPELSANSSANLTQGDE